MPYVHVGKTTFYYGKTLWEILGCLKDHGVGRIIKRQTFNRHYPEPSFFQVVKVAPEMDEENKHGGVLVDSIFRGKPYGFINMYSVSYKPDYELVPKHEEKKYLDIMKSFKPPPVKILPREIEMPPLMKLKEATMGNTSGMMEAVYNLKRTNNRVAREGEEPTVIFATGIGTPASSELYEGIDL